ncbi:hypothetical protein TL16_g12597 [Triparma laevis f. inornata]|uniref:PHD-type domain-containing protein n=1 Tax=Triparma laevis f. inornata TaxID=1714386 RepID=A0A9W7BVV0_9STRA|nr:hypothetical protein TL16_g12597 [Triparma laevis f. inornata]
MQADDLYKPRIGDEYQAVLPKLAEKVVETNGPGKQRKKRGLAEFTENGEIPDSNLLWSPSHFNSVKIKDAWTVDKFILFMRNMMLQTETEEFNWRLPESTVEKSTTTSLSRKDATAIRNDRLGWVRVFPLQQDANMLEFLQKHDNDIDRALFAFMSEIGGGREANARKWRRYYEGKAVATGQGWKGVINRRSTEIFKPHAMGASQEITMDREERGGLKWYNPISRDCLEEEPEEMDVEGDEPSSSPEKQPKGKGNADLRFLMSNSQSMNLDLSTSRSRGSDKSEMRQRWQTLHDDLVHVLESIEAAEQPAFHEVMQLLTDCTTVTPPEPIPGDDFVERVNLTMKRILVYTSRTRNWVAQFHDMLRDTKQGVLVPPLRKILEKGQELPFKLNDVEFLENFVAKGMAWEQKLEKLQEKSETGKPTLAEVRELLAEAKSYPFPLRNAVKLSEKVAKTIAITTKIEAWTLPPPSDFNLRAAQVLLRDAHRANIAFPALATLTKEVETGETWNEDSVKAHRNRVPPLARQGSSRTSGDNLHINSDEMLEKIKNKIATCEDWTSRIYEALGFEISPNPSSKPSYLTTMAKIRTEYVTPGSESSRSLERFNIDGAKLPAIVDEHLLLVAEIKARGWSTDAEDLLSSNPTISALNDMIEDSSDLRGSLPLPKADVDKWEIRLERQVKDLATTAKAWLAKYDMYNGASPSKPKVCTLPDMRALLNEANEIKCNLSAETEVMENFIKNAETWSATYASLLALCSIVVDPEVQNPPPSTLSQDNLTLDDLKTALTENRKVNPKIELKSIAELRSTVKNVERWQARVEIVFPKNEDAAEPVAGGLRRGAGVGIADEKEATILFKKPLAAEMEELITQTAELPIKFEEELERMKTISTEVKAWQVKSAASLKEVDEDCEYLLDEGLDYVKEDLMAEEQTSLKDMMEVIESSSKIYVFTEEEALARMYKRICSFMKNVTEVFDGSDKLLNQDFELLPSFIKEADAVTTEMEKEVYMFMVDKLKDWTVKVKEQRDSLKAFRTRQLEFNKFCQDVIKFFKVDKPSVKAEDKDKSAASPNPNDKDKDNAASAPAMDKSTTSPNPKAESKNSPSTSPQPSSDPPPPKKKSHKAKSEQEKNSHKAKAPPQPFKDFAVLQQLSKEAAKYPKELEMVRKVKREMDASLRWLEVAEKIISPNGTVLCRISMEEANDIISNGEKLLCTMKLVKVLRSHKAMARKWASKVRKQGLEKEGCDTSKIDVEGIALEMEQFCVDMPDEALILRQASSVYCICRKPYDGFMLGCDGCQEWYHGPCLGITERQAENINNFLCVRCAAIKTYKDAAQEGLNCCNRWLNKKVRDDYRKKKNKKLYDRWRKAKEELANGKRAMATAQGDLQRLIASARNPAPATTVVVSKKGGVLGGSSDPQQQQQQQQKVAEWHSAVDSASGKTYYYNAEGETRWDKPEEPPAPVPVPVPAPAPAPAPAVQQQVVQQQQQQPEQQPQVFLQSAVQAVQQALNPVQQQAIDQAQKMIDQIAGSVKQLNRVVKNHQTEEKKLNNEVTTEERFSEAFSAFFGNMKNDIFMPNNIESAIEGKPGVDGLLSPMMQKYIELANTHNVISFADVLYAIARFEEMSWAFMCLETLKKRPKLEDLQALSARGEGVAFSDERAIIQCRSFLKRASDLSSSIKNIMQPQANSKSPFNINALKILCQQALIVPVEIPETAKATACIEDEGNRYCVCGGASDGRFMLVCEKCEIWCHGPCMSVSEGTAGRISKWVCSKCANSKNASYPNYDEMARKGEDITKTAQILYKTVMGDQAKGAGEDDEENPQADDLASVVFAEAAPQAPRAKPEEPWTWAQYVPSFNALWPPFGMAEDSGEFAKLNLEQIEDTKKRRKEEEEAKLKQKQKLVAAVEKKKAEEERLRKLNSVKYVPGGEKRKPGPKKEEEEEGETATAMDIVEKKGVEEEGGGIRGNLRGRRG